MWLCCPDWNLWLIESCAIFLDHPIHSDDTPHCSKDWWRILFSTFSVSLALLTLQKHFSIGFLLKLAEKPNSTRPEAVPIIQAVNGALMNIRQQQQTYQQKMTGIYAIVLEILPGLVIPPPNQGQPQGQGGPPQGQPQPGQHMPPHSLQSQQMGWWSQYHIRETCK